MGTYASQRAMMALFAGAVLVLACAVDEPPSGGPEDKDPPRVASTVPRSDSTGVDPGSPIRIGFSEPMRKERVERMVTVSPPIEFERVSWQGDVLQIDPAGELVRDTTYVVRIKPDYTDRHGVPATLWHEFAFATGTAPLDTARIEGKVMTKHGPAGRAIVRAFRHVENDTLEFEKDRPDREVIATRNGEFSLRYLPSSGRFVVMAFTDQNTNRVFNYDVDPSTDHPDTVVMVPEIPVVKDVELVLLDPKEPGSIEGTVVNETGADSARVLVDLFEAADTTRTAYRALVDSTGAYAIKSVSPGEYIVRAFVDIKADSTFGLYPCAAEPEGCREPSVRRPGELRLKAGARHTEPALVIRRKDEP